MTVLTKKILIVTTSFDASSWQPVAKRLSERGYDVTVFEEDKIASGETVFEVRVDAKSKLLVRWGDRSFYPKQITAAWFRATSVYTIKPRATQLWLDHERRLAQSALWDLVPTKTWLNQPENMYRAEKKILQLTEAQKLGFTIPKTIISNTWEPIMSSLPKEIVLKTARPIILYSDMDDIKNMFTTPLKNARSSLPIHSNPFPGIWQERIPKSREWRITVVGEKTFDAAIYTSDRAKDDWRRLGTSADVTFKHESFPDKYRKKCIAYLKRFGLKYGAFDFIEDPDGRIIFLECNTNGQFYWLEKELGLPISAAIADELETIALAD